MRLKIVIGALLGVSFVACSETPRDRNNTTKTKPTEYQQNVRTNPILVSVDNVDEADRSNILAVEGGVAILLADKYADYDSAVSTLNRNISARSSGTVSINASGQSLLTLRVDYDTTTGEIASYRHYEYDPTTNLRIKRTRYNSSGVDLIWLNGDDGIQNYSTYHMLMGTIQTSSIRYIGAGIDALWFTEDDEVESYEAELHAADGTPIGVAIHNGAGVDTLWFTEDDDILTVTEDIIAADGNEHWVMFTDAGADADWTTFEDNTVGNFSTTMFNADSLETKHILFGDTGVDLVPFTEDDIPQYYHSYTHNAAKLESNKVRYNGPGIDTLWLTADDAIDECEETTFSAENHIEQELDTHVGADNLCFSGDDIIVDYNVFAYDATGHLTDEYIFNGAGVDGIWHTEDDVLKREYVFTPL